jgi:hypothetical protein
MLHAPTGPSHAQPWRAPRPRAACWPRPLSACSSRPGSRQRAHASCQPSSAAPPRRRAGGRAAAAPACRARCAARPPLCHVPARRRRRHLDGPRTAPSPPHAPRGPARPRPAAPHPHPHPHPPPKVHLPARPRDAPQHLRRVTHRHPRRADGAALQAERALARLRRCARPRVGAPPAAPPARPSQPHRCATAGSLPSPQPPPLTTSPPLITPSTPTPTPPPTGQYSADWQSSGAGAGVSPAFAIKHPFGKDTRRTLVYDAAILLLSECIPLGPTVSAVKLATEAGEPLGQGPGLAMGGRPSAHRAGPPRAARVVLASCAAAEAQLPPPPPPHTTNHPLDPRAMPPPPCRASRVDRGQGRLDGVGLGHDK